MNLDSILKSRGITLPTKVHIVKAMVFPVVMYGCESWKDWCWSFNTLGTWGEGPTHWKRPWCWERLKAGREGDDRGQGSWMWHHQLSADEFEWILGVGDGQGGLACCGPRGREESDMTEQLNWTDGGISVLHKDPKKHRCDENRSTKPCRPVTSPRYLQRPGRLQFGETMISLAVWILMC